MFKMNVPHEAPSGELKKSKGSLDLNGRFIAEQLTKTETRHGSALPLDEKKKSHLIIEMKLAEKPSLRLCSKPPSDMEHFSMEHNFDAKDFLEMSESSLELIEEPHGRRQ
ncbi:uncharacterized protein [Drosophila virilis]|uniref:Uncharacterized protein, isoform A n=1 Tax=Drosophila virilis TaxID=7244 RepID=B4M7L0_DROVI|nr:uncharacterized protein LOC6633696 [Drosophila virilis]XP_015025698.1 uncharacterized protein LOC6633696 [Drosophila virilis]EDW62777.2 uncharacterized protein Dvir_GJ17010, isoform A [Drosophila virilis]KRF80788.1 uncharacterized protein Dvir_GJ17010, isoform B [Drosophila virilis]KRF80789.1 uncharacterized protein Dvir_GJ17010, isoform C [Drosophila virilis]